MAVTRQTAMFRNLLHTNKTFAQQFSTTKLSRSYHYKLVIVGGGTGGSSIANKYAKKLGVGNVAVIEPNEVRLLRQLSCHRSRALIREGTDLT